MPNTKKKLKMPKRLFGFDVEPEPEDDTPMPHFMVTSEAAVEAFAQALESSFLGRWETQSLLESFSDELVKSRSVADGEAMLRALGNQKGQRLIQA